MQCKKKKKKRDSFQVISVSTFILQSFHQCAIRIQELKQSKMNLGVHSNRLNYKACRLLIFTTVTTTKSRFFGFSTGCISHSSKMARRLISIAPEYRSLQFRCVEPFEKWISESVLPALYARRSSRIWFYSSYSDCTYYIT